MQTLILNHYPPVIKNIKDMQQIAKSEDIEFAKLNTSIEEVLSNMFVLTADENGVKRFEKLLEITPKAMQSLNDRKMYIIAIMNQRKMSLSELTVMLSNYCEDIKLIHNMLDMEMTVETGENTVGISTINKILEEILPVNIYYHFLTKVKRNVTNKIVIEPQIGAKLKVNPLLQKDIKTRTKKTINAVTYRKEQLKVNPSLEKAIKIKTSKVFVANLQIAERIKIVPLLVKNIKANAEKEVNAVVLQKECITINPLLKKEITLKTRKITNAHLKTVESIVVNPLLAEKIKLSVKKEIKSIICGRERIEVKPYLPNKLSLNLKIGYIGIYPSIKNKIIIGEER